MLIDRSRRLYRDLGERPWSLAALHATQLFLLSFGVLVAVGTVGFLVLPGLYTGDGLGLVDALFTATSAVCVTGLIVVDTATYFTPLGQAWIALLIQLGGLGILTFTTLVIGLLGRRSSLGATEAAGGHATALSHLDPGQLARLEDVRTALAADDVEEARRVLRNLRHHLESIFFRGDLVLEGSQLDTR